MKITDIKQQVKRQNRYSVYVDGKYACSFSDGELLNLGLRVGQELTEGELAKLKDDSRLDKAYSATLNLISHRPRSEWELRDYLKRKGVAGEDTETILNKLSNLDYVNDQDFARRWIENRRLLKPVSKRRLSQELRQKRVPDEVIKTALEEDKTDESTVLRELIERKRKQSRYQDDLKLMQYLARQGFSYDDIKSALDKDGAT
jgi:regulatory protein